MTLVLDQAKFSEKLETGSTSVYALEFTRPDASRITALWTIRGQREVKLALADDGEAVLWDAMGNQTLMQSHRQVIEMTIGSSPVYITGVDVVRVNCGRTHYPPGLAAGAQVVDKMETLDAWTVEAERDEDFEEHIWDQLRHPGKLKWENADDATRGKVLRVALDGKQAGPSTASFYNRLRAIEPKVLRGEPQYLGLWVDGNSSWARITFELVDAEGDPCPISAPRPRMVWPPGIPMTRRARHSSISTAGASSLSRFPGSTPLTTITGRAIATGAIGEVTAWSTTR